MSGQFGEDGQVLVPESGIVFVVRQNGPFRRAAELEMFVVMERESCGPQLRRWKAGVSLGCSFLARATLGLGCELVGRLRWDGRGFVYGREGQFGSDEIRERDELVLTLVRSKRGECVWLWGQQPPF